MEHDGGLQMPYTLEDYEGGIVSEPTPEDGEAYDEYANDAWREYSARPSARSYANLSLADAAYVDLMDELEEAREY